MWVDIAITYGLPVNQRQRQIEIAEDRLILVSTRENSPIRFDPDYVYVEAGQAFARAHAAEYADAGTARLSFGTAVTALEF